jgi:hypothetical protein
VRNNNLSNRPAPSVAFHIDTLLFKPKIENPISLGDKVKSIFKPAIFKTNEQLYLERPLNHKFRRTLEKLWMNNNITLVLVTTEFNEDNRQDLEDLLAYHNVHYTRLETIGEWEDLRNKCFYDYMYLFSDNNNLISYLSVKNAKYIDTLWEVFS